MSEETSGAPRAKLGSPLRCPWCHQPSKARALRVRCEGCGVGLHVGCAREAKACPTLGCAEALPAPAARSRRPQPSRLGGALIASAATLALGSGLWRLIDAPLHAESSLQLALEHPEEPAPLLQRALHPALHPALQPEGRESGAGCSGLRAVERPRERSLEAWRSEEVARGLSWLTASQSPEGTWSSDSHSTQGTTALAVAAFAVSGSTHESGPHQARIHKALSYLRGERRLGFASFQPTRPEDMPLYVLALSFLHEASGDTELTSELHWALGNLNTTRRGLNTTRRSVRVADDDPVWTELARSAAAAALGDVAMREELSRKRYHSTLEPDLVELLEQPKQWVASSWFVRPNSPARAAWRASLVVHLHHLQHPAGPWTGDGGTDQLNLSWSTARNVLALRLLGD